MTLSDKCSILSYTLLYRSAGLILAGAVHSWKEQLSRLRLSQLLDMYYSHRGVNFDPRYRACERQARLKETVDTSGLLQIQVNSGSVTQVTSVSGIQDKTWYWEWYSTFEGAGAGRPRFNSRQRQWWNFSSPPRCVQTGSGANPVSYSMGTRGSTSGGKAAWAWSWPLISI
jgi:hypothetical protein